MVNDFNEENTSKRIDAKIVSVSSPTFVVLDIKKEVKGNETITTKTEIIADKKGIEKKVYGDNSFSDRIEKIQNPIKKFLMKDRLDNNLKGKAKTIKTK